MMDKKEHLVWTEITKEYGEKVRVPWRTDAQAKFLRQLMRSRAFEINQYENTLEWIDSAECSKERCSRAINKAKRITDQEKKERDLVQKQALADKMGNGGYPGSVKVPPQVRLAGKEMKERDKQPDTKPSKNRPIPSADILFEGEIEWEK